MCIRDSRLPAAGARPGGALHGEAHLGAVGPMARPELPSQTARRARPRDAEADRRHLLHGGRGPGAGMSQPFVSHVSDGHAVNWSDELEELHEESSRTHFIDVWTRRAMIERLGHLPAAPTVIDVGCSTGYLLEDLRRAIPQARLIGVDLVAAGLH